jgi:hypothetical protein
MSKAPRGWCPPPARGFAGCRTGLISGRRLDDSGEGGLFSQLRWLSVIPFLIFGAVLVFTIRKKLNRNGQAGKSN